MAAVKGGSRGIQPLCMAALVIAAAAAGFLCGLLVGDAESSSTVQRVQSVPRTKFIAPDKPLQLWVAGAGYSVLGSAVWPKTVWGRRCTNGSELSSGELSLCQLPSIWRNCSQGIYIDLGTNVGGQLRKLYDPWQFPEALVLGLYNHTYGHDRRGVCAIGVEANPVHTPYLKTLNAYFRRKGYQAVVLTDTAASIASSTVKFYQDHGSPVEWGASLTRTGWIQKQDSKNTVLIPTLDVPAFMADIVRPMLQQAEYDTGVRPPVGMKMDVEGAEYALLPGLITSGGLCDLDMIYLEPHPERLRDANGAKVGMSLEAMEKIFGKMSKANPRCKVNYSHLDDESYLYAHTEVPLPK